MTASRCRIPVNICLPSLADFGTLAATVGQREIPAGGEKSASAPKAETPSDDADEKTSYIEPFNCTLRQRLWRLVRKTLSFSQKLEEIMVNSGHTLVDMSRDRTAKPEAYLKLGTDACGGLRQRTNQKTAIAF